MADDDARNEQTAEWLAVEPLDEVTRRRLVSTALASVDTDTASPSHSRGPSAARWIAAAAAIVVVLVVGLALLTAPGGNDEQQASTPVRTPAQEKNAGSATAPQAADSAAPNALLAPVDVGDFGDLDVATNLDRMRTALEAGAASSTAGSTSGGTATTNRESAARAAGSTLEDLDARSCRDALPAGTVTALARGTLDDRPAIVVLTTLADGSRSIDAVLAAPCEVRPLS